MEQFVIRVYGIVINSKNEVLISDEYVLKTNMTKFPGGGLEFGEGPVECLKREFREECNQQELNNIRHFYTTDFFQKALYYENAQLLSIYYLADLAEPIRFKISDNPFDFTIKDNCGQSFRWVPLHNLTVNELNFPIDRIVATKLKKMLHEK